MGLSLRAYLTKLAGFGIGACALADSCLVPAHQADASDEERSGGEDERYGDSCFPTPPDVRWYLHIVPPLASSFSDATEGAERGRPAVPADGIRGLPRHELRRALEFGPERWELPVCERRNSPGAMGGSSFQRLGRCRETWKGLRAMRSLGGWLFFFGVGTIVLNLFGYEFIVVSWIDRWGETGGWILRGSLIGVGLVLYAMGPAGEGALEEEES